MTEPEQLADYGAGACLSCGGRVVMLADQSTDEARFACDACGAVDYVAFENDQGQPVQGFMALAEITALPGLEKQPDDSDDIPFWPATIILTGRRQLS